MALQFEPGKQFFVDLRTKTKPKATAAPKAAPRPVAKAISKPKAKKVTSSATKARQRAAAAANKKAAAFRAQQAKESKALEAGFREFRTGLEPLDILRKRLAGELGIPGLQEQLEPLQQRALRLGQLQLDLPENIQTIAGRQGKAFRDLLETSKGEDLARQLRDVAISQEFFAGQLTGARGELTEQLGVTQEQREFDLRAFGQEAGLVNTRLARELTGFTTDLQREFESIIGDITRAEQLTDAKVQRAFELAKLEKAAGLEAGNIRLRGNIAAAAAAKEEAAGKSTQERKNAATTKFVTLFSQTKSNPNLTDALLDTFTQQFPEFAKDFRDVITASIGE